VEPGHRALRWPARGVVSSRVSGVHVRGYGRRGGAPARPESWGRPTVSAYRAWFNARRGEGELVDEQGWVGTPFGRSELSLGISVLGPEVGERLLRVGDRRRAGPRDEREAES
jgi:hypothetical protein